jgi:hypothetical protein
MIKMTWIDDERVDGDLERAHVGVALLVVGSVHCTVSTSKKKIRQTKNLIKNLVETRDKGHIARAKADALVIHAHGLGQLLHGANVRIGSEQNLLEMCHLDVDVFNSGLLGRLGCAWPSIVSVAQNLRRSQ